MHNNILIFYYLNILFPSKLLLIRYLAVVFMVKLFSLEIIIIKICMYILAAEPLTFRLKLEKVKRVQKHSLKQSLKSKNKIVSSHLGNDVKVSSKGSLKKLFIICFAK